MVRFSSVFSVQACLGYIPILLFAPSSSSCPPLKLDGQWGGVKTFLYESGPIPPQTLLLATTTSGCFSRSRNSHHAVVNSNSFHGSLPLHFKSGLRLSLFQLLLNLADNWDQLIMQNQGLKGKIGIQPQR